MAQTTTEPADLVPMKLRTALYLTGAFLGLGIAPALLAAGQPVAAAVVAPLAGACNAVAFGYRPTRTT